MLYSLGQIMELLCLGKIRDTLLEVGTLETRGNLI